MAVGVGVSMLNSAKITRTSAVHLERSQRALNVSCSPVKVYRAARTVFDFLFFMCIGGPSPFLLSRRRVYKLPKLWRDSKKYKSRGTHLHRHSEEGK